MGFTRVLLRPWFYVIVGDHRDTLYLYPRPSTLYHHQFLLFLIFVLVTDTQPLQPQYFHNHSRVTIFQFLGRTTRVQYSVFLIGCKLCDTFLVDETPLSISQLVWIPLQRYYLILKIKEFRTGRESGRGASVRLSSPRFQQKISDILLDGDGGYRPDTQFDGSQVHLDLNEPVSGPSHAFMALGGTPSLVAHVPGGSWEVPFMEPARLLTPPASPAPAEQPDQPAARGRAHRAPRHPPCGTGSHRVKSSNQTVHKGQERDHAIHLDGVPIKLNGLSHVDEEYIPKVGMTFLTIEEANVFYKEYAKRAGFATKIRNSNKNKDSGAIKNQLITCNREGKTRSDLPEAEKTNPMSPANCPTRIYYVHIQKKTQLFVISKVVLEHSHPCSTDQAQMLPHHRQLSMHVRRVIENNH
ncbi:hypothetical protein PIB30_057467 [Stylosanthes scabra]|uniref:FAR1 domain-containing protein n=1 Tax=Stylosanthes scabra TaxID=79078 RepID=A0ABU6QJC0_9FABA|nr:hypothetical protein [Stylosanthes scabra]